LTSEQELTPPLLLLLPVPLLLMPLLLLLTCCLDPGASANRMLSRAAGSNRFAVSSLQHIYAVMPCFSSPIDRSNGMMRCKRVARVIFIFMLSFSGSNGRGDREDGSSGINSSGVNI